MDAGAIKFVKRRNLISRFSKNLADRYERKVAKKIAKEKEGNIAYYTRTEDGLTPEQAEAVKNNIVYASRVSRNNSCDVTFSPSQNGSSIDMRVRKILCTFDQRGVETATALTFTKKPVGNVVLDINSEKPISIQIKEGIQELKDNDPKQDWGSLRFIKGERNMFDYRYPNNRNERITREELHEEMFPSKNDCIYRLIPPSL